MAVDWQRRMQSAGGREYLAMTRSCRFFLQQYRWKAMLSVVRSVISPTVLPTMLSAVDFFGSAREEEGGEMLRGY